MFINRQRNAWSAQTSLRRPGPDGKGCAFGSLDTEHLWQTCHRYNTFSVTLPTSSSSIIHLQLASVSLYTWRDVSVCVRASTWQSDPEEKGWRCQHHYCRLSVLLLLSIQLDTNPILTQVSTLCVVTSQLTRLSLTCFVCMCVCVRVRESERFGVNDACWCVTDLWLWLWVSFVLLLA